MGRRARPVRGAGASAAGRVAALLAGLALLAAAGPARAEVDWPLDLRTPDRDVAIGVRGGVAFGEARDRRTSGALGGVDVSLLHGLFGLHLGLDAAPEGRAGRMTATLEASWWYVVLVGAGVTAGWSTGDLGPGLPDRYTGATALFGIPFLLARIEGGRRGALVLMPYARPGLRFVDRGEVEAHHQVGLMLKWTSFGF